MLCNAVKLLYRFVIIDIVIICIMCVLDMKGVQLYAFLYASAATGYLKTFEVLTTISRIYKLFFSCFSVLQRTMRDWPVPLPRQDRRFRLGSDPGYCHHRQTTEANKHRLRQLRYKVGLE